MPSDRSPPQATPLAGRAAARHPPRHGRRRGFGPTGHSAATAGAPSDTGAPGRARYGREPRGGGQEGLWGGATPAAPPHQGGAPRWPSEGRSDRCVCDLQVAPARGGCVAGAPRVRRGGALRSCPPPPARVPVRPLCVERGVEDEGRIKAAGSRRAGFDPVRPHAGLVTVDAAQVNTAVLRPSRRPRTCEVSFLVAALLAAWHRPRKALVYRPRTFVPSFVCTLWLPFSVLLPPLLRGRASSPPLPGRARLPLAAPPPLSLWHHRA